MASLTIRGLDDAIKTKLRLDAARHGVSMEEAARRILRRALTVSEKDAGGLGSRVRTYFVAAGGVDLVLPERSAPRGSGDFSGSDA